MIKHTTRFDLGWRHSNTLRPSKLPKLGFVDRLKARRSLRREQSILVFWCKRYWPIAFLIACYFVVGYVDQAWSAEKRIAEVQAESDNTARMFGDFLKGGTLVSGDGHFAARCSEIVEVSQ